MRNSGALEDLEGEVFVPQGKANIGFLKVSAIEKSLLLILINFVCQSENRTNGQKFD